MKPKFLHTSDIHLSMKFNNKQFSLKEREKRREELWDTFEEIIQIVKTEEIAYLFIAGELIQSEYSNFKTLKRIIHKFKQIKDTKIIITCGSSDPYNINSLYEYIEWPKNVIFIKRTDKVEKLYFEQDNLCIYSISWDKEEDNSNSQLLYDISVDENKINVLLLYCDAENMDSIKLPINPNLIKNKFDYSALGSKHNYKKVIDNVVYSGTPEPLSFEEEGEHGVIKGILDKNNISYNFYPIAKRKFINRDINLDSSFDFNKILDLIKFSGDTFSNIKDYVKVNLNGVVDSDISIEEVKNEAKQFFYYIEFEEKFTYKNTDERPYEENEFNIIESYKRQFEKMNYDDKLEQQAFELGLKVLRKEKVVR